MLCDHFKFTRMRLSSALLSKNQQHHIHEKDVPVFTRSRCLNDCLDTKRKGDRLQMLNGSDDSFQCTESYGR